MTASTELIILNTTKFREDQLVLHTLSRAHGRRSFLVRVGKRASMGLFLPLNLLEGDVTDNPKSSLWTVRNLSALHPLNGIRSNLYKNTMTLFMSEVLFRTLREGTVEEGLFDWCRHAVLTLDALESDFSNYPIRFLLEFAAALGFSPTFDDIAPFAGSADGAGGIPGAGGSAGANGTPGGFNHLRTLEAFLGASFSESMLIPLSGADRNAIAEELIRYLEFHTEIPLNIRSLKVLRELYGA